MAGQGGRAMTTDPMLLDEAILKADVGGFIEEMRIARTPTRQYKLAELYPFSVARIRLIYRRLLAERGAAYAASQEKAMGPR